MALSITMSINASNSYYHPAYNDANYVVQETNSAIYTAPNFRFICEVVIGGVTVVKLKNSIYNTSTNHGVFNVGRIVEAFVQTQWNHNIVAITHADLSYVQYTLKFGYEYSASATTAPVEYLNVTSRSDIYAFSGAFPFTDMNYYNENDWIFDDANAKFLNRVRTRTIYRGQYDFQTFLLISTSRPDRIKVIAYPSGTTSEISIPSTLAQKMYYMPSGFNLNIVSSLISGTVGNVLPSGTTHYTLQALTATTPRSEVYTYYVNDDCSKYDNNDILFVNRYGGLSVIRMPYKRVDTYEAGRTFMRRNDYLYVGGGNYLSFNLRGSMTQWDNTVQQKMVFQSGLIAENEVPLYEDLIMSPVTWLINGAVATAIMIEDSSFENKTYLNEKVIQYTINAKLSFKNPTQRL